MQQINSKLMKFFNQMAKEISKITQLQPQLIEIQPLISHIDHHLDEILSIYSQIVTKIIDKTLHQEDKFMGIYESQLQLCQAKVRNQIRIEIQLKLYYEQLLNSLEKQKNNLKKLSEQYLQQIQYCMLYHRKHRSKTHQQHINKLLPYQTDWNEDYRSQPKKYHKSSKKPVHQPNSIKHIKSCSQKKYNRKISSKSRLSSRQPSAQRKLK